MMLCNRCKKKESLNFLITNQRLCRSCLSDVLLFRMKKEIKSYNFMDDDLSKFSIKAIKRKELVKIYPKEKIKELNFDINLPFFLEFLDAIFIYHLFYDIENMERFDKLLNYSLPLKFVSQEELDYFDIPTNFDFQYNLLTEFMSLNYERLKEVYDKLLEFFKNYPGHNESLMKSIIQLKTFDLLKNPQR